MEVQKWKAVIGQHLPKRAKKMFGTLMLNIIIVDCAIKPSYLYDISAPDAELLSKLLSELLREHLIKNCLTVLSIGMDCLIINIGALTNLYSEMSTATLAKLVDVSANLPYPTLVDDTAIASNLVKSLTGLVKNISFDKKVAMPSTCSCDTENSEGISTSLSRSGVIVTDAGTHYVFNPVDDCNISSVFGLLLGYPVVYWYRTTDTDARNCLSMEPLVCVKLLGISELVNTTGNADMATARHEHEIYSFSYPASLKRDLEGIVGKWLEHVQYKVRECSNVFTSCSVHIAETTCEAVNL